MKDMLTIIYTSKNGICTMTEFMQYLQYVYKGNKAIFCMSIIRMYEGHLESKEHFTIKKYLLITGKKKNMQVLSHTFTYFST